MAAPVAIPLQGAIADGSTGDGARSVTFALWAGEASSAPLWSLDTAVLLDGGVFTTVLSGGTPALDASLIADNRDLWLSVAVDGASSARVPVGSVPFAVWADHAGTAGEADHAAEATEASHAAEATHADDATTLAGRAAS